MRRNNHNRYRPSEWADAYAIGGAIGGGMIIFIIIAFALFSVFRG